MKIGFTRKTLFVGARVNAPLRSALKIRRAIAVEIDTKTIAVTKLIVFAEARRDVAVSRDAISGGIASFVIVTIVIDETKRATTPINAREAIVTIVSVVAACAKTGGFKTGACKEC